MQKQIKFIYALLVITLFGSGLVFLLQNKTYEFIQQDFYVPQTTFVKTPSSPIVTSSECYDNNFKKLEEATNKKTISNTEFSNYVKILKKLDTHNDNCDYSEHLTATFGKICKISDTDLAVQEYINYLNRNEGSAEEELSFQFEYLFAQNPTRVLSLINNDQKLLDVLEWGIVNNNDFSSENYEKIFYEKYPTLKNNKKYENEVNYLLYTIKEG